MNKRGIGFFFQDNTPTLGIETKSLSSAPKRAIPTTCPNRKMPQRLIPLEGGTDVVPFGGQGGTRNMDIFHWEEKQPHVVSFWEMVTMHSPPNPFHKLRNENMAFRCTSFACRRHTTTKDNQDDEPFPVVPTSTPFDDISSPIPIDLLTIPEDYPMLDLPPPVHSLYSLLASDRYWERWSK